jgi:carboxyl-terminal processing protease
MKRSLILTLCLSVLTAFFITAGAPVETFAQEGANQKKTSGDTKKYREESLRLLDEIKSTLKKYYYDPKYRGIDIDARFEAARTRIKSLEYNWQMYRVLVQVLMDFNDSHTSFRMPSRTDFFDYGFATQMFGDQCFVISVKKDSDAEKKGLQVGDQVLSFGKFAPSRGNLWKIMYVLYRLDPSDTVELKLAKLDGTEQALSIKAKTQTQKERREELKKRKTKEKFEPFVCREVNAEIIACRLNTFSTDKGQIDKMMKQVGAHKKLVLDLRGNGGGYVDTEVHLISYFFDRDVKVADLITREKTETRFAKSRGDKTYKGEVVVLVDSRSASAAEMTARVLQLEKRAKVVGDISSGAVMTSIYVPLFSSASAFADIVLSSVGMSVTIADVVMKDGSRLENVGVIPDVPIIPNGLALSKKVDPVLSYAASMFGAELTPEKAGEFHFITKKEDDGDLNDEDEDK